MEPDEVVGAQFRVHRLEAGYLRLDHAQGAELTAQSAREVLRALASLAAGDAVPVLVDARTIRSTSREARKMFAGSAVPSRVAVLVDSPLSRTLANFYIGVSSPDVPTKMFTGLADAERWLLDDR